MEMYLHPIMVHFAIALYPLSVFFDTLALVFRQPKFHFAAWTTLILSGIALLAAIATGLMARAHLTFSPPAHSTFQIHQTFALLNVVMVFLLLFWRTKFRVNLPPQWKWLYLVLSVLTVGSILLGGFYGGKLVYHHGIGISVQNNIPQNGQSVIPETPRVSSDELFYPESDSVQTTSSE